MAKPRPKQSPPSPAPVPVEQIEVVKVDEYRLVDDEPTEQDYRALRAALSEVPVQTRAISEAVSLMLAEENGSIPKLLKVAWSLIRKIEVRDIRLAAKIIRYLVSYINADEITKMSPVELLEAALEHIVAIQMIIDQHIGFTEPTSFAGPVGPQE